MQKATVALGLVIAIALATVGFAHGPAGELDQRLSDSETHWINQSGSTMTLSFNDCGTTQPGVCTLSGVYVNNASGYKCQGTPYQLTGVYYIDTQTISWSVAWSNKYEDCASVTGWTGYLVFSSPLQFKTDWNLAYSTGGSGRAIMQGQDTFTQTDTVESGSLIDPN